MPIHEVKHLVPQYGCIFVVGSKKVHNPKYGLADEPKMLELHEYCNKLREGEHTALCSKHELIVADAALEASRRAKKAADTKRYKKEQEAVLAESSLRVPDNPKLPQENTQAYSR